MNRAAVFAALGEPARLALVERLLVEDLSPADVVDELGIASNLLAHHLRVLERAGVIQRTRSEGDRRRSYIQLRLDDPFIWTITHAAAAGRLSPAERVVFVCTANSARSQLAAASWSRVSAIPAASAGTHPAPHVHPRAVEIGRRHGLHLEHVKPAAISDVLQGGELIVAVCDNAHEELHNDLPRLHWSVPDPVRRNTDDAFEDAYHELQQRVQNLATLQATARKAS
jgi:protein-tyrosine-phosphatase